MFTGLVREVGASSPRRRAAALTIEAPETARGAQLGDSVAVDGVCLTVVARDGRHSLSTPCPRRSRARRSATLEPGSRVNLEPALRAGEPLGGHYVQGHVDGVGARAQRRAGGRGTRVWFDAPPELLRYVVEKGSIAVAGHEPDRRGGRRRPASRSR